MSISDAVTEELFLELKAFIDARFEHRLSLGAKLLSTIEKRVELLETSRKMVFRGPHDPAADYAAGDVTQRSGSTWVALVDTKDKPGDSTSWRRIGTDR